MRKRRLALATLVAVAAWTARPHLAAAQTAILPGSPTIIFIDGFMSSGSTVQSDFDLSRRAIDNTDPHPTFIYFSYAAGPALLNHQDPHTAWVGNDYEGNLPNYASSDTTNNLVDTEVLGLDWLLKDLLTRNPGAGIDIVGFSLGGVIALRWAATQQAVPNNPQCMFSQAPLCHIHRIITLDSPLGGINPKWNTCRAIASQTIGGWFGGDGVTASDLMSNSSVIQSLPAATKVVDVAAIENSSDYVVNGVVVPWLAKEYGFLPNWIALGPCGGTTYGSDWLGQGGSSFLGGADYYTDLGRSPDDSIMGDHGVIIDGTVSQYPALATARQHLVDLIMNSAGPLYSNRVPCDWRANPIYWIPPTTCESLVPLPQVPPVIAAVTGPSDGESVHITSVDASGPSLPLVPGSQVSLEADGQVQNGSPNVSVALLHGGQQIVSEPMAVQVTATGSFQATWQGQIPTDPSSVGQWTLAVLAQAGPVSDALASPFYVQSAAPPCASYHPGDVNGDGRVDLTDFSMLAADWMQKHASLQHPCSDFNGDGVVDLTDFSILASNWGWTGTVAKDGNLRTPGRSSAEKSRSSRVRNQDLAVGDMLTVPVSITSGPPFNAAQATVIIPSNLSLQSIAPGNCGFAYTVSPTTSNSSFAGAITGGSSTGCTVYTMTLQVVSPGSSTPSLSNAELLTATSAQNVPTSSSCTATGCTLTGIDTTPPSAAYSASGQPSSVTAGSSVSYNVTLTNTGSRAWSSGGSNPVHLGIHFASKGGGFPASGAGIGNGWLTDQRYSLPADVPPGASVTLSTSVSAPSAAGPDVLEYQMVEEGVAWFAQYQDSNVSVTTVPSFAASYTTVAQPVSFTGGQSATFWAMVTNTGSQTWPAGGSVPVHLSVHFAPKGGGYPTSYNSGWLTDQRFALRSDLGPGASVTLTVTVTAPSSPGTYILEYQMVREGVAWLPSYLDSPVSVQSALGASYSPSGQPSSMAGGQSVSYYVTVTNTGTQTWQAAGNAPVHLGIHFSGRGGGFGPSGYGVGNGWLTDQRYALPQDVAPGQSVTLSVSITAPPTAGSDVLEYQMVEEGVAWFPQYLDSDVSVTAPLPALAASYNSSSQPRTFVAGQSATYTVSVTNTGSQTWSAGGNTPMHLRVHFMHIGGGCPTSCSASNLLTNQVVALPSDVGPGQTVPLNVTVQVPSASGTYVLEYQMVEEGVAWFPQYLDSGVSVVPVPALAASYSTGAQPSSFTAGLSSTYQVTVANTGTATWQAGGSSPFTLRIHFMHTGGGCPAACGSSNLVTNQAFVLPNNVAPGQNVTLVVNVQVPSVSGNYVLEYQMVEEGAAWFTQYLDTSVTVS